LPATAASKTYNAVLADYPLPQFTAHQVLDWESKQEIPLILITGSLGKRQLLIVLRLE